MYIEQVTTDTLKHGHL